MFDGKQDDTKAHEVKRKPDEIECEFSDNPAYVSLLKAHSE